MTFISSPVGAVALPVTSAVLLMCPLTSAEPPDYLHTRIATLEAEIAALRTRVLPFKELVALGVTFKQPINHGWGVDLTEERLRIPYQLSDEMTRFLALTPAQRQMLIGLIIAAKAQVADEIARLQPLVERTETGYRLVVPAFPEAGARIEQELRTQVLAVLGQDRMTLWGLDDLGFFRFGKYRYTFTFNFIPVLHHEPQKAWQMLFTWVRDDDQHEQSVSPRYLVEGRQWNRMRIDAHHTGFVFIRPYLPDDLVRQLREEQAEMWRRFDAEAVRRALRRKHVDPPAAAAQ